MRWCFVLKMDLANGKYSIKGTRGDHELWLLYEERRDASREPNYSIKTFPTVVPAFPLWGEDGCNTNHLTYKLLLELRPFERSQRGKIASDVNHIEINSVLLKMNMSMRLVWRITIRSQVVIRRLIASHLVITSMFAGVYFPSLLTASAVLSTFLLWMVFPLCHLEVFRLTDLWWSRFAKLILCEP